MRVQALEMARWRGRVQVRGGARQYRFETRFPDTRDNEVFSPGFAVHGRAREASLQVSAASRPSAECLLAGACSEEPRWKSLTTRCRPGQRGRPQPSTGYGFLVRKPQ